MSEQLEYKPQQMAKVDDEINLIDLLIVLARHKKLVIGMPLFAGGLAMTISLLMTPIFTSTAKLMPPQQQSSGAAALLGQLGGLAGMAGSMAGIKSPNDLYVGMLESRTISDRLIDRFKLQERYESKTRDDARLSLEKTVDISNGKKDGLISISVSDKDPQFAADLANAYVEELTRLNQTMAVTEASQRRLFFEQQLKEAKEQLANAEVTLRQTQERTGLIQPEGQVQAMIASIAQLRATIAAKEVQLKAMRTFATTQNPDLMRTQEELRGLQGQLAKLEKSQPSREGDFMASTGKVPEAGVEYVRSLRNVKYYETMFELLAKQYELARIDESREASVIQILDKAVPAERKSKPKRALITLLGLAGGGMLGVLLAFMREGYLRSRQDPANGNRWKEFSAALTGRRA